MVNILKIELKPKRKKLSHMNMKIKGKSSKCNTRSGSMKCIVMQLLGTIN